jgi:hypothetical protein
MLVHKSGLIVSVESTLEDSPLHLQNGLLPPLTRQGLIDSRDALKPVLADILSQVPKVSGFGSNVTMRESG